MLKNPTRRTFTEEQVIEAGLTSVERAIESIYRQTDPGKTGLFEVWCPDLKKWLLFADHDAQLAAEDYLEKELPNIQIRGEESTLRGFQEGSIAALLDMLDGSDLLKRDLGNWCSAMTIFEPDTGRINAALIGMPNKEIYYMRHSATKCAFKRTPRNAAGRHEILELNIERKRVPLKDAAVAFYGQKPAKLLAFANARTKKRLTAVAAEMAEKREKQDCPKIRIYNLAGNPMMVKLLEGHVDAVIEISGQRCHDVVPGFIIALRAQAVLKDLENKDITEEDIAYRMRDPEYRFKYVLACDEVLASELVELLKPAIGRVT